MTEQKKSSIAKPIAIAVIVIIALVGIGIVVFNHLTRDSEDTGMKYAAKGVMVLDDNGVYDTLEPNSIALEFKNDAYSNDGKTFACYLGNSALNEYDMYVAIYADAALTEMLYLSDLVPPGSGFEEITLDQSLEKGDHRVYIAFTQMEDPNTIHAQTIYTMDFHVIPD